MRPRLLGLSVVGGIARFSRSWSASTGPVKFWKPADDAGRDAGEQDRREVGAWLAGLVERVEVREHARVEHWQQPGELGLGDVVVELLVAERASAAFQQSFSPTAMSTSLTSG